MCPYVCLNNRNHTFTMCIPELTTSQKFVRVFWHYIGKIVLLLAFLYVFICSLSFLGDAFQLLGGNLPLKIEILTCSRFSTRDRNSVLHE